MTADAPVDDLGRATVGPAASVVALASMHQASVEAVAGLAWKAIEALWGGVGTDDLDGDWGHVAPRVYGYLSVAQEMAAATSSGYTRGILARQGLDVRAAPISAKAFAGRAADGRDAGTLLQMSVIRTKTSISRGASPAVAKTVGGEFLRSVVLTETVDAAAAADSVAIASAANDSKTTVGWVRMVSPNACGRCAVLAGKFYRWNDGFLRHPRCSCVHIPSVEAVAGDVSVDPEKYFESLSRDRQDRAFGKANAEAIRLGGDMNQVVAASGRSGGLYTSGGRRYTREGTTKRGFYRRNTAGGQAGEARPTPWQIIRDADGDEAAAYLMLDRYGYVT
jgi:hypothetical protein